MEEIKSDDCHLSLEDLRAQYVVYSENRKRAIEKLEREPVWLERVVRNISLWLKYNFLYRKTKRFIRSLPIFKSIGWDWIDKYFKNKDRSDEQYVRFYNTLMDFLKFRLNLIRDWSEKHSEYNQIYRNIKSGIVRIDEIANNDKLDFDEELNKFTEFEIFWKSLEKYLIDEFEETMFHIFYTVPSQQFITRFNQAKIELWYGKRTSSKREEKKVLVYLLEQEEKEYFKKSLTQDELDALLDFPQLPEKELDEEWIDIISRFYRTSPVINWDWDTLEIRIPHYGTIEWTNHDTFLDGEIKESSDWTKYFYINHINVHSKIRWIRISNILLDLMMKELIEKNIRVVFWILRDTSVLKTFWRFFWKEYIKFHNHDFFERNNLWEQMNYEIAEISWMNYMYVSVSFEGNWWLDYWEEESWLTRRKRLEAEILWKPTDNITIIIEKCYWKRK